MPKGPLQQVVLERSRRDVAVLARHLRRDLSLGALREGTLAGRVDDGGVRAGAVGGDNVHGTADGAAAGRHLRQGGAGLCGDIGHLVERVLALALGFAQAVRHGVLGLEDGGIDLGLGVRARAGDDAALDAEGRGVAASITSL